MPWETLWTALQAVHDEQACGQGLQKLESARTLLATVAGSGSLWYVEPKLANNYPASSKSQHALQQSSQVLCLFDPDNPTLQAHKVYLEGTEHRTAAFNKLTQGDASAARVIEQRMKKLIKLQVRMYLTADLRRMR